MKNDIHPKLRKNTISTLRSNIADAMFSAIESKVNEISFPFANCIMCDHWNDKEELCKLYKARPPARVIAFGCPSFVDEDYIPF